MFVLCCLTGIGCLFCFKQSCLLWCWLCVVFSCLIFLCVVCFFVGWVLAAFDCFLCGSYVSRVVLCLPFGVCFLLLDGYWLLLLV